LYHERGGIITTSGHLKIGELIGKKARAAITETLIKQDEF
jgi:hypothetical protein